MDGRLRNMTALYILSGDRMLMLYRVGSRVVAPSWCGVGGHFEKDELNDAKAAMLREVQEEIGLSEGDLDDLALRYITLRLKRGEIRQNYYFFANLRAGAAVQPVCGEGRLEWVRLDEVEQREMPFSAKCMMAHYFQIGRTTDKLYCGATCREGIRFAELAEF